jgi:hypothetical protein
LLPDSYFLLCTSYDLGVEAVTKRTTIWALKQPDILWNSLYVALCGLFTHYIFLFELHRLFKLRF